MASAAAAARRRVTDDHKRSVIQQYLFFHVTKTSPENRASLQAAATAVLKLIARQEAEVEAVPEDDDAAADTAFMKGLRRLHAAARGQTSSEGQ